MSLNIERHTTAWWSIFEHLARGEPEKATAIRIFYEEYFAVMRPSQSSATEASRSGFTPSLAQQKAAVTALPPNDTAKSRATALSSPVGSESAMNVTSI